MKLTVTGKGGSATAERQVFIDPFMDKLILVPGGTFMMGCTPGDPHCDTTEFPVHEVTLDSFYLGITEVTQAEWELLTGENPSDFACDSCPIQNVSWMDAMQFIQKMNGDGSGYRYSLPTEAQWEYAARAGEPGNIYSGGNDLDLVGWYAENSSNGGEPVGGKAPNAWGFYDMSGNIWELCLDRYGPYQEGPATNPAGPATGPGRVARGGHWSSYPATCRVSFRWAFSTAENRPFIGFRLARN